MRKPSPWVRVALVNSPQWPEIAVAVGIFKDSRQMLVGGFVGTQALS